MYEYKKDGDSYIEYLLETQDTSMLEWVGHMIGYDKDIREVYCDVIMKATVRQCIAMQRYSKCMGVYNYNLFDYDLLCDFIAIHCASVLAP